MDQLKFWIKPSHIFFFIIIPWLTYSQEATNYKDEKQRFALGSVSPVILPKDGLELNLTNSLTSYWYASQFGTSVIDRSRISRSEHFLSAQYGFSDNQRWDLGIQARYSQLLIDENSRNSPFKVFSKPDVSGIGFKALSMIGLRARAVPFEGIPELTIQGAVHFPVAKGEELRAYLGAERIQADFISTYFRELGGDFYYFLQGRYLIQIANVDNNKTTHFPGLSAYLIRSLFDQKLYIFPGLSFFGAYQQNYMGGRLAAQSKFVMLSLGVQIQPSPNFGLFLNAQTPWYLKTQNSFYSSIVKSSYSDWALGLRFVL